MPEFPGYNGPANPSLPVIKVTAITTRRRPIMQTIVGPGEEHVLLAGIPTEASILKATADAMPCFVRNCFAHPSGGGKFLVILQVRKTHPVDDDMDLYDTDDVLWAMNTRYQWGRQDDLPAEDHRPSARSVPVPRVQPRDPEQGHQHQGHLRLHRTLCPEGALRPLGLPGGGLDPVPDPIGRARGPVAVCMVRLAPR